MVTKTKITTLELPLANTARFPYGCPILKALAGKYGTELDTAIQNQCELVTDSKAELVLIPSTFSLYSRQEKNLIRKALKKSGLPSLAFDIGYENTKPDWITHFVRFSWYKTEETPGDITSPPWIPGYPLQLSTNRAGWTPLPKGTRPKIGFCGREGNSAGLSIWNLLPKNITRLGATIPELGRSKGLRCIFGSPLRRDAMQILKDQNLVEVDFLTRLGVQHTPKTEGAAREEFENNLLRNHYSLCTRGSDNYSYRFFETLAAGRIPVLIDSNCTLPLEGKLESDIPWDQLIIRVPCKKMKTISRAIQTHFDSKTEPQFAVLQHKIRTTFEKLKPETFYPEMLRRITKNDHS